MMRNKASKKGRLNHDPKAETNALQIVLVELRGCIEGFTTLTEEEGERWKHEMHSLEKHLYRWKDSTDHELNRTEVKKSNRSVARAYRISHSHSHNHTLSHPSVVCSSSASSTRGESS